MTTDLHCGTVISRGDIMARKQTSIRFTEEVDQKLNSIAKIMKMTRTDVIVNLITAEYDRIHGNPEMLKMIEKLNAMKEEIENYGKTVNIKKGEQI